MGQRPTSSRTPSSRALAGLAALAAALVCTVTFVPERTPGRKQPLPLAIIPAPSADPWAVTGPARPTPPNVRRTVEVPRTWLSEPDIADLWTHWLATVPDGTTIRFPGGTLRTSDWLLVQRRHDLVLEGAPGPVPTRIVQVDNGSQLDHAKERSVIVVHSSRRIRVSNLTIVGANPRAATTDPMRNPLEGQHGITVTWDSTDAVIDRNDVRDTYGDGIAIQGRATRVRVTDNTVANTGRQGISSLDAFDVTIARNKISDVALDAIDVEPNFAGGRVQVADNHLAGRNARMNASGPVLFDVAFSGNSSSGGLRVRLRGWPRPDGSFQRLQRIAVVGNHATGAAPDSRPEIEALNVDFLTVEANRTATRHAALWLEGSCPVRVQPDESPGATRWTTLADPTPASGSAPERPPTVRPPRDALWVDPMPWLTGAVHRTRDRAPSGPALARLATGLCRDTLDTADVGARLLLGGTGPTQRAALAYSARVASLSSSDGGSSTPAARSTHLTGPRGSSAESTALLQSVALASFFVHDRAPTAADLRRWIVRLRTEHTTLASLIRAMDGVLLLPDATTRRCPVDGLVGQGLTTIEPVLLLLAPPESC